MPGRPADVRLTPQVLLRLPNRSGYPDKDLAERLVPPKTERKKPRVLTKPEYEALLRACSHHVRDSAVIELLLQRGCGSGS